MFPHLFFGFYNAYIKGDIEINRGNYISMQCTHIYIYNMYNIDKYLRKKKRRIATFVYLHKGLVVLHSFFTLSSVRRMHIAPFFFFFLKHRNVPVHSSLKKQITNIYDLRCSITVSKSFKNARCMKWISSLQSFFMIHIKRHCTKTSHVQKYRFYILFLHYRYTIIVWKVRNYRSYVERSLRERNYRLKHLV